MNFEIVKFFYRPAPALAPAPRWQARGPGTCTHISAAASPSCPQCWPAASKCPRRPKVGFLNFN